MSGTQKITIGLGVVAILALAAAVWIVRARDGGTEVRVEEIRERELVSTITATGAVRPRRQVNISSDEMGRVVQLLVEEGDEVVPGQVLLRLDSTQLQAAVARNRAAVSQAEVQASRERASFVQAERELGRLEAMEAMNSGIVSVQALDEARTRLEVQQALHQAAVHNVDQARANLEEASERLARTTIRAPIAGRVTRLNIEEGETAVVGTMNNPGSLLLTISDLSVVEAVLSVDETDIPRVSVGDSAIVELDAFPNQAFAGRVAKIGQSAIGTTPTRGQAPGQERGSSVDFEVVVSLLDPPDRLRPDLSATADIIVDSRAGATAAPIISVTIRDGAPPDQEGEDVPVEASRFGAGRSEEGVFLVRDGRAVWQPVELGITGREYFEVVSGVSVGDTVVSGPYETIRSLEDGAELRITGSPEGARRP